MTPASLAQAVLSAARAVFAARGFDPALLPESTAVERPRNPEHGDYASTLALQLAKKAGVAPRELATALAEELAERFAAGQRPPAPAAVSERVHADFLAGGLVRVLAGHAADPRADAASTAQQTWHLLRGGNR